MLIGTLFRFYELNSIPTSIHADEASQSYNAFSLLHTGKDMYGKAFPILFRANGSFQPPVYTYLTIIPVMLFGNTMFTTRFISALSGSLLILITFLFLRKYGFGNKSQKLKQALFGALAVAISPWGIHFSRLAVEGNLVVIVFALALYVLLESLKHRNYFILGAAIFGLTTHVYYSDRITAVLFLPMFLLMFWREYLNRKKEILVGFILFALILLPHLFILKSGALTKRLTQVSYLNNISQDSSTLEKVDYVSGQFMDHYLYYFSPKNLFFDSGQNLGRTTHDLSVFYPWFFVFVILGISILYKNRTSNLVKIIVLSVFITPIAAGLTGDLFYPLRVLDFLWIITIIIGFGFLRFWDIIRNKLFSSSVIILIVIYSLFTFYVSYFVASKYEGVNDLGSSFIKLMDVLENYSDKKVLIDYSGRTWGAGMRYTYLYEVDPVFVQNNLQSQMRTDYYSSELNPYETHVINNIIVKQLNWKEVCGDVILVGDAFTVSPEQINEHKLKLEFSVNDMKSKPVLFGYSTTKSCNN